MDTIALPIGIGDRAPDVDGISFSATEFCSQIRQKGRKYRSRRKYGIFANSRKYGIFATICDHLRKPKNDLLCIPANLLRVLANHHLFFADELMNFLLIFPFPSPIFFSHFSPSLLLPLATIAGKKLPFFSHFVLLLLDDGPAPAIFYLVGKRTTTMHNEIISVRHSIVCPHCRNNK